MSNNLEKFRMPASSRQRDIDEGMVEEEEVKADNTETKIREAHKFIDYFHSGFLKSLLEPEEDYDDYYDRRHAVELHLKERLAEIPSDLHDIIFQEWFKKYPKEFIFIVQRVERKKLPDSFQEDFAAYLDDNELKHNEMRFIVDNLLEIFEKIKSVRLSERVLERKDFYYLAENRGKFPCITDAQILEKIQRGEEYSSANKRYIKRMEWQAVIPYIDQFKTINAHQVIEGVLAKKDNAIQILTRYKEKLGLSDKQLIDLAVQLKQTNDLVANLQDIDPAYCPEIIEEILAQNRDYAILFLIRYKEKLGLSDKQLIDLAIKHKQTETLLSNLKYIDSAYHGEIAIEMLKEGKPEEVLVNASQFKQVDILAILNIINSPDYIYRSNPLSKDKKGFDAILNRIDKLMPAWGTEIPQDIIDRLVNENPEKIAPWADRCGEKIDKNKLAKKLLDTKKFQVLINTSKQLEIALDALFAARIIEAGGAPVLIHEISKFKKLPRAIYISLLEERPQEAYRLIMDFEGITKADVFTAIEKTQSSISSIIENVINGYALVKDLSLDKEFFLFLLIKCPWEEPLKYIERFSGLDAEIGVKFKYSGQDNLQKILQDKPELKPNNNVPLSIQKIWSIYDDNSIPQLIRRGQEAREYVTASLDLAVDGGDRPLLARLTHYLSPAEYVSIVQDKPELVENTDPKEINSDGIVVELEKILNKTDSTIASCLATGVQHFGAKVMLKYMNRPDLPRHDSLHFIDRIIEVQQASGVAATEFSANILLQVANDDAQYSNGTAHHYFFQVIDSLATTPATVILEQAQKLNNIQALQKLTRDFTNPKETFGSWKNLKKLYEIKQLLDHSEILEEINSGDLSDRKRRYLELLAFHPNINAQAVIKFWKQTSEFLGVDDVHTPAEINRVKKPSNLLSVPYLGLGASDFFDILVEGHLDAIQALPPYEHFYYFGVPDEKDAIKNTDVLYYAVRKALGERKNKIAGVAANVPKLFSEVQAWCKQNSIEWKMFFDPSIGVNMLSGCSTEAKEKLGDLVYDKNIGIRGQQEKFQTYRARIGRKSDPEMVVAGNDTASCMPFGSGKNNVYMFNPTYAQMVVERLNEEGKWRTAAQSVMSIDHKTARTTPELMGAYFQDKQLKDLVQAGDLENLPVVTCDNIEPAKNEEGQRIQNLHDIYQSFFTTYLQKFAQDLQVSAQTVAIGTGYTPAGLGFEKKENHYIPTAPAGYSDNIHATCFVIETGLAEVERKHERISSLKTRDALSVGVLEGKAFADNANLLEGLHKIQYSIMGIEMANAYFNRPNLSFMYRDNKGTPHGYILAYEGRVQDTSFVHLDDLSSDREHQMAGGRLIKQFFDAYTANYGTAERPYLPIFTNARDATSYPILMRHAVRLAKEKGLLSRVIEIGMHTRGRDTMHDVVVVIGKTEDDLRIQEKQMRKVFSGEYRE